MSFYKRSMLLGFVYSYVGATGVAKAVYATCCSNLALALPGKVSYPNSTVYEASVFFYWALQEELVTPSCIVSPTTASEVAAALEVIVLNSCRFAVRGGGHGTAVQVANIENGVTIDLRAINSIALNTDKSQAVIGGAALLGDVYTYLADYGVSIPGARAAGIGVGGSTLGARANANKVASGTLPRAKVSQPTPWFNMKLFSPMGTITTASESENADLWRALKGGGSNFGIVTKLVFNVFLIGDIWAGDVYYTGSNDTADDTAEALFDFTANPNYDANASIFVPDGYFSAPVVLVEYTYTAPLADAPVFDEFEAIPGQVLNTTGVTTLPELSKDDCRRIDQKPANWQMEWLPTTNGTGTSSQ